MLAPLANFLAMLQNALDRTITISMPGCPSASAKNELTKLTEEELNERVIKATGMTLKEATKPLTGKEYINHPEVLKFRKQFAEQLKYTPIEEWYKREKTQQLLSESKETPKHTAEGKSETKSRPVTNKLSPMKAAMGRLSTALSQKTVFKDPKDPKDVGKTNTHDVSLKANFCKDAPDKNIREEPNDSISSCTQAKKPCSDFARKMCPATCGLCPSASKVPKKTCKITAKDVKFQPDDEVPAGFVDYQAMDTTKGYCVPGSAASSDFKPHKALKCHEDGTLKELPKVYCHDPTVAATKHRWVECVTCASILAKKKVETDAETQSLDETASMRSKSAKQEDANLDDTAIIATDASEPAETQRLWGGGRRRRWHAHVPHRHHWHIPHRHHIHIPHRWHVHVPHRHHFHAAAIVKSIGHGVVSAIKKIGELYCYKIKFNVMDIIKGIGNFLSWMMKPIELAVTAIFNALGISLPGIPGLPGSLPLPPFGLNINWPGDFLYFNWDVFLPSLTKLAGFSVEIPRLGC